MLSMKYLLHPDNETIIGLFPNVERPLPRQGASDGTAPLPLSHDHRKGSSDNRVQTLVRR